MIENFSPKRERFLFFSLKSNCYKTIKEAVGRDQDISTPKVEESSLVGNDESALFSGYSEKKLRKTRKVAAFWPKVEKYIILPL